VSAIKAKLALWIMAGIGHLPLSVVRATGAALARLAWYFQPREVRVTQRNIDLCYPQLSQRQRVTLARRSLVESGKLSLEISVVWHHSVEWLMGRIFTVHGQELITGPQSQGQGVIVICPHMGNWEVIGIHSSSLGDMGILYQPPKQAYLEPMMRRSRARMGATQLTTDVRGVAGLFRILKKGGMVGILPDQVPDANSGEFADFFGRPAYTMTLVSRLIEKTGCRAVMATALRRPGGFEVFYSEPPSAIYSVDVATSLRGLNEGVEAVVAMDPAQYQWEYKRFRKVPPGEPKLYVFK